MAFPLGALGNDQNPSKNRLFDPSKSRNESQSEQVGQRCFRGPEEGERGREVEERTYVFLYAVTTCGEEDELELALHLSNGELGVESVRSSENQKLCALCRKELA